MLHCIGRVVLGLAAVCLAGAAVAEGYEPDKPREQVLEKPLKDCTPYNARFGYYGNPWCTPEEQARWDRWSARQSAER